MSETLEMTCARNPKWAAEEIERLRALQSETTETHVWSVENKTSFALFRTEDSARSYVSGFPASVGGGMTIAKLAVLE